MAKKKSFLNISQLHSDPALSFISRESLEIPGEQEGQPAASQKRLKRSPEYIEVKSRRVQLVLQPSLYAKVKEACTQSGLSFNEYCHQALEKAVGGKKD